MIYDDRLQCCRQSSLLCKFNTGFVIHGNYTSCDDMVYLKQATGLFVEVMIQAWSYWVVKSCGW